MQSQTVTKRKSDLEIVTTRNFNAPPELVFEAWTNPVLFAKWWLPKSYGMKLFSCALDVQVGGTYRLVFDDKGSSGMAFFGTFREVVPNKRIVWTNEESADGAITTLTLTEKNGKTLLTMSELYPTKAACDAGLEGAAGGLPETFEQLEEFLASRGA
jgi:uncharacterized protein YndB with AHSA1/START domain